MKLQRSETERKIEKPKGKIWQIFEDLKSRKDDEQNLEYITPTIFVKMWGLFSYARPFDEKLFFGGKLAFRSTCFISTESLKPKCFQFFSLNHGSVQFTKQEIAARIIR